MIAERLARELNIGKSRVEKTIELIDQGNTIPFIARYRKEITGGLSDVLLRELYEKLTYMRNLDKRKDEIIRLIGEQEKMTPEVEREICEADTLQKLEDLYRPFKQKKRTRASIAIEKGLDPLAKILLEQEVKDKDLDALCKSFINEELQVQDESEALKGALDILAEIISDNPKYREEIRNICMKKGSLRTEATDPNEESVYEMYYDYSEGIHKIPSHRILAINRGEKEKKLNVKFIVPLDEIKNTLKGDILRTTEEVMTHHLEATIEDALKRLIMPSIEREIRNILYERAEKEAVKVFGQNTEKLLMAPPLKNVRVMAVDPSFRTGCKIAILDETGKLLDYTTIFPNAPRFDIINSKSVTKEILLKYNVDVVAIGNGTASRETEQFIADTIKEMNEKIHYTIVSEAGASVYSASKIAAEEYPELDVTTRGALSIGRRLQDSLAELVKIDPKHIGVGQYQHDVSQSLLDNTLKDIVEDCVNRVGVDLNTASPSLLKYVSGINGTVARNIVQYREEKGKFRNRKELRKIPKVGEKTFEQCAGFLRIADGECILDNTAVHPESYDAVYRLMALLEVDEEDFKKSDINQVKAKILTLTDASKKAMEEIAVKIAIGVPTLQDIVSELKKPGRDPREELPGVVLRSDVLKLEDLRIGMELMGTVRNVVDFGAFVDIGVKDDGLVHISQISDKYIKHPSDAINVGDIVKVKIMEINESKGRISLTMKGL
ncbi:MAG: Tex family protein [Peptostreptococcales bacterium]